MAPDPKSHPISLSFQQPLLEADFRRVYQARTMNIRRKALLIGMLLFAAFALIDPLILPSDVRELAIIRFTVVVPYAVVALALSYHPFFKSRMSALLMLGTVLAGGGLVAMILLSDKPESHPYFAGLILVLMYAYTFTRLRFIHSLLTGWTVTLAYGIAVLAFIPFPLPILTNNVFFLLSANVLGMVASYQLEGLTRQEFVLAQTLKESAIHDPLTGLFNRRHLDQQLETHVSHYRRYGTPFSLILLDLDGFKTVNDRFGHLMGDAVLQQAARLLQDSVRDTDIPCRFGGDEFVVVFPETRLQGAQSVVDRLVGSYSALTMPGLPDDFRLTFSAGICEMNPETAGARHLLEAASQNLRLAKEQGRSRVIALPS